MNRPARLLIADFGATRLGVRLALADQELAICAEAGDAAQAIVGAKLARPDICLVGSELPGGGMTAVRGIREAAPAAAIIVLADTGTEGQHLTAVRAGATGYIPGTTTGEQLRRVFESVLAGEAVLPDSGARTGVRELQTSALVAREISTRQAQVLDLLRHGHAPAEIARRLEISPVTVRRHISELVRRLGLQDRSALMELEPAITVNTGPRR